MGGGRFAIFELTTDISYTVREWQIMMKVKALKCILNKEVQNSYRRKEESDLKKPVIVLDPYH